MGYYSIFDYGNQKMRFAPVAKAMDMQVNGPAIASPLTCAKPGDCGLAYQACCAGMVAKGFPCGCHLQNGNGTADGDCGTCGTAYSVCCAGFRAKGFPCTCDIHDGSSSIVV